MLLHRIARYLPLLFGVAGLMAFLVYGVASGELRQLRMIPVTGLVISVLLILMGQWHRVPTRVRGRYYSVLLGAYGAGVLFMGLRPKADHYHFAELGRSRFLEAGGVSTFDVLTNVIGFIPLGFLIVVTLTAAGSQTGKLQRFAASVLLSGAISLLIEIAQHFIVGRASSAVDVATNGLGALIGAVYALLYVRLWQQVPLAPTGFSADT